MQDTESDGCESGIKRHHCIAHTHMYSTSWAEGSVWLCVKPQPLRSPQKCWNGQSPPWSVCPAEVSQDSPWTHTQKHTNKQRSEFYSTCGHGWGVSAGRSLSCATDLEWQAHRQRDRDILEWERELLWKPLPATLTTAAETMTSECLRQLHNAATEQNTRDPLCNYEKCKHTSTYCWKTLRLVFFYCLKRLKKFDSILSCRTPTGP